MALSAGMFGPESLARLPFALALIGLLVLLAALAWWGAWGRPPAPDARLPAWLARPSLPEGWRARLERGLDALWIVLALLAALLTVPQGADWQLIAEQPASRATPLHLLEQRVAFGLLGLSRASLITLALVDLLILIGALLYAARAFGRRSAAIAGLSMFVAIGFELGPLRWLGLAALIAAFAATQQQRWMLSGALLAFATLDQLWPGFFALALALHLIGSSVVERRIGAALRRWSAGFFGAGLLLFGISLLLPGGVANWVALLERLAGAWEQGHFDAVGLRWLFLLDGNIDGGRGWVDYPDKLARLTERIAWVRLCAALLLVPVLVALRRLEPVLFASIAGCTAMFGFASVPAGAYVALGLLLLQAERMPMRERPITLLAAAVLGVSVGMHALLRVHPQLPFVHNVGHTSLLLVVLLGLALTLVLEPELRDRGDDPRLPASVPVKEVR